MTPAAPVDSALGEEEVFGPIRPVRMFADLDAAITWIAARPAPLAIDLFGATREGAGFLALSNLRARIAAWAGLPRAFVWSAATISRPDAAR